LQTWELQLGGFRGPDRLDMTPDWRSSTPSFVGPMSLANWTRGDVRGRFEPYLELPRGHLASSPNVTITYLDANGASQPLASSVYRAEGAGNDEMEGRIWLARGQQWPATDSQFDAVKVQYQVGWDSADQVPAPIRPGDPRGCWRRCTSTARRRSTAGSPRPSSRAPGCAAPTAS
jgi:hypothetical protein